LPENAFGVDVDVKVPGFDDADGASFFPGFPFCSLAVGKPGLGRSFGKRPFAAAVGVD